MTQTAGHETIAQIHSELYQGLLQFQTARVALNGMLLYQHQTPEVIDLSNPEDKIRALVLETGKAFGGLSTTILEKHKPKKATDMIVQSWLIDDTERTTLLNELCGTEIAVVHQERDIAVAVEESLADDVDAERLGGYLQAEYGALLYTNLADYVAASSGRAIGKPWCVIPRPATRLPFFRKVAINDIHPEIMSDYADEMAFVGLQRSLGLPVRHRV